MFVRLTHQVLKGISYSQSIVTRRFLCSSDKDLSLKNTKHADKKLQYEIEAEEVMSNLSEEGRQKKKRLEVQLEIMRQRNEKVPSKLSQTDWMILVNECNGDGKERSFIEYLYEKEETRLKRKIFKK
ncbi:uncharacterized protein LOC132759275, partial [Ruditapes philippinarum]|uniref:uncharacterized protein LOC132759275 n=1 Tax=Ruditapes philippinarum TaxID=129788 RepID=UPI00295B4EAB